MIGIPTNAPSQSDKRMDLNAEDQFGRAWLLTIEKATGDPTGQITQAGWDDPLHTPQVYLKVPRNRFGQPAHGHIEVTFARWITESKADLGIWVQRLYQCAQKFYPSGFDPKTIHEDPLVAQAAGPQPWPPIPVLEAASKGHQGFLGLAPLTEEDRRGLKRQTVEDLLREVAEVAHGMTPQPAPSPEPETWPEFLALQRKAGKSAREAASAWNERKTKAA